MLDRIQHSTHLCQAFAKGGTPGGKPTMNPYTQAQSNPALDFFQSLLKSSGMSPSFASWMAPTLDADELERKIVDLRIVLQWLEANVRLTQATIQGLEVQRMTLSTLKTMNVDLGDLAAHLGSAMRAGAEAMGAAANAAQDSGAAASEAPAAPTAPTAPEKREDTARREAADAGPAAPSVAGVIDPMQWWSTLSEQFAKVASDALRDSPWPKPAPADPVKASPKPSARPRRAAAAASGVGKPAAPGKKAARGAARPAGPRKPG